MTWQEVQRLRRAGDLDQAEKVAVEILAADPGDFRTKSQYEWVIYDRIKLAVADMSEALEDRPIDARDVDALMVLIREYYKLQPRKPEMSCSNIIAQVVKVGPHLPRFPDIIGWVGMDGLRPEDWQPNEFQGRTYNSLATKIALALCKWIKAHPDASEKQERLALDWAERAKKTVNGEDALWLNWNLAVLLRQMGEFQRAAELLAGVIKAKRNEFWVWAEAGRLYLTDQPELALACFCRALECPSESKFLVRTHRELAELLAEEEEFAQASREIAITIDIRQEQGWPVGRELEALIASPWYDPTAAGTDDPQAFYAKHSSAALALCFDVVETKVANYLGVLLPHPPKNPPPHWKPKPLTRFAIKDTEGQAWTLVGPRIKNLKVSVGEAVLVVIGQQEGDDRQTIVSVSARPDGKHWDCLESDIGVVTREAASDKPMKVFVVGTGEEWDTDEAPKDSLSIGDGVRFGSARNPKNNRVNIFNVERGKLPEQDVKLIHGQLRRNQKRFGFVDDAFVPPYVIESLATDVIDVVALAVYAKHPTKGGRSWRVIKMSAA